MTSNNKFGGKKITINYLVTIIIIMKSAVFWDVVPCDLVKVGVSEERVASIFRAE
jgi:hypothetical protein